MTISTRPSAPLFVVVGATGTQGQSIIHALSESPNEYRVRAITRDPNKPAAQELKKQGCELVAGDLDDPASIAQAFRGAQIVFGMTTTDYWSSDGEEKVGLPCVQTWQIESPSPIDMSFSAHLTVGAKSRQNDGRDCEEEWDQHLHLVGSAEP